MRAIFLGIATALLIAGVAGAIYYGAQEPVYRAQAMDSVRIGDPGFNLVGPQWTGDVPGDQSPDAAGVTSRSGAGGSS
jgi:hypothetical protein